MKLSKKQFTDFIVGSMRDNGENGWGSEQEHAALEALRNDSLEIEGYERSQWVKFDPNDPKTFPPVGGFLGYFDNYFGSEFQGVCFRETEDTDDAFATHEIYPGLTHWRPLPPPPVETEETK